jgi:arginine utilization protein RocB
VISTERQDQWREVIEPLLLRLIAARSDTNTAFEAVIEELILTWIKSRPYFCEHPELMGTQSLEDDIYQRKVVWALVRGESRRTVVLFHHHDAVGIADYGKLQELALRPDDLADALSRRKLSPRVRSDLESGKWLFGRGSADMKSGAAIQMAVLSHFSAGAKLPFSLLLLSVPDEETLSRGMLQAVRLMRELRRSQNLEYVLSINSEPYFNQVRDQAILFEGSVGKIMPIMYVKGVRSHVGDPYAGLNPSLVMANLQRLSELNTDLCDRNGNDATPPPVWVNLKDRKRDYDASIPEAAAGYFNWLTFTRSPVDIMIIMKKLATRALDDTLKHHESSYLRFCEMTGEDADDIDFEPEVLEYRELHQRALQIGGSAFLDSLAELSDSLATMTAKKEITLPEAAIRLLEFVADAADLEGPAVVLGLSGPYYPHVSNESLPGASNINLAETIDAISRELYGVRYESRPYFMGISDTSYAAWVGDERAIDAVRENSPGWDRIYHIPFDAIRELRAPVLNLGPWGKDLHKPSERVYADDVYRRIPEIITRFLESMFGIPADER